ncbi:hypothetical protein [Paenibacillus tianjinensis]|uniref:Replication-associated protein G2P N-terminal domain-containing protein n=1 Tax=Paenibacillus tianjinensis TaxID=2810347 RepID=A0ABX7LH86_9BACL|nr:hypothetical protein [Paenibacillus tianjinensis]QSF45287.1 hypothetical protein JRJ22_00990 [Paenibacillus tianjinensis]
MTTMLHTLLLTTPLINTLYEDVASVLRLPTTPGRHSYPYFSQAGFREITLIYARSPKMKYRGLEIRLNPQVLLCPDRVIHSTSASEISKIPDMFAIQLRHLLGPLSDHLPHFNDWTCKRIDYCVDIRTEHVSDYIRLFQRSKVPNRFFQAKNKLDGSAYAKSGSVTLNFYDKEDELRKRILKSDTRINEQHLEEAHHLLRIEVQCESRKTNYLKQRYSFYNKGVYNFLHAPIAEELLLGYYDKSIGAGDFYSLYEARKIIRQANIQERTKEAARQTLELIAQVRSVDGARKQFIDGVVLEQSGFIQGSSVTFSRYVKLLRELGINPITIPRGWKIHHLPNLRENIVQILHEELTI